MTSTTSDAPLRFASFLGRAVAAAGAIAALALVAVLFELRFPYKPGFVTILAAALLGLAGSVWWLGGVVGRVIARRGRVGVAWGPVAGVACLAIGALSLAIAVASQELARDARFGLGAAVWGDFGKPLLTLLIAGALPAAVIGLVCAAVIHGVLRARKRGAVPR